MTKQDVTYRGQRVQAYRHPTPVEIEIAILRRLITDKAATDGRLPIPARVSSLVRQGIADACRITEGKS